MEQTLNQIELGRYSKEFSQKSVDFYFINRDKIAGNEILKFSPITQVNLFIIKIIFDKWQSEIKNLKSPYFDYEHASVQKALANFMNVLSQHISVGKEDFQKFVEQATKETLLLTFKPHQFLVKEIQKEESFLVQDWKEKSRYFRLNKDLYQTFLNNTQKYFLEEISKEQALEILEDVFSQNTHLIEPTALIITYFSQVLTLDVNLLLNQEQSISKSETFSVEPEPSHVEIKEFSKNGNSEERNTKRDLEKTIPYYYEENIDSEITSKLQQEVKKNVVEEEELLFPPEAELKNGKTTRDSFSNHSEEEQLVPSLNDKLKPKQDTGTTVLESYQQAKIDNIRSAITLNLKFLFINQLFQGNNHDYNEAIDCVNHCSSLSEADKLLRNEYASRYNWNFEEEAVIEFYKVLEKKFG